MQVWRGHYHLLHEVRHLIVDLPDRLCVSMGALGAHHTRPGNHAHRRWGTGHAINESLLTSLSLGTNWFGPLKKLFCSYYCGTLHGNFCVKWIINRATWSDIGDSIGDHKHSCISLDTLVLTNAKFNITQLCRVYSVPVPTRPLSKLICRNGPISRKWFKNCA